MLDAGRVVDVGTHDELDARCPLYRLLLSGPGEDAEGIDAGELPEATADTRMVDGITPALWRPVAPTATARPMVDSAATAGAGGPGSFAGVVAALPPTEELLAQVAALPPATGDPDVDEAAVRAPDPHFTLGRLLRPLRWPLLVSLVLVAIDALAALVLPVLTRTGVDRGVRQGAVGVIALVSLLGLAVVLADLLVNVAQVRVAGRTGERLLYALRLKSFAHLQRLGLDYYEREMSGRIMTRMTTDIDAFSTFLQTGLTTALISVVTFVGITVALLAINL